MMAYLKLTGTAVRDRKRQPNSYRRPVLMKLRKILISDYAS